MDYLGRSEDGHEFACPECSRFDIVTVSDDPELDGLIDTKDPGQVKIPHYGSTNQVIKPRGFWGE